MTFIAISTLVFVITSLPCSGVKLFPNSCHVMCTMQTRLDLVLSWVLALCVVVDQWQQFRETCCLHLQG